MRTCLSAVLLAAIIATAFGQDAPASSEQELVGAAERGDAVAGVLEHAGAK